ncbi:MAG: ligand-gated channel protein [Sandaracinus sp.]|nr:ligand-gated channel protein [Sandaracinus sp.]|tara:strand:+ start:1901 stop:4507 length:2607 start_codon:yes stop_codon:yes gene_type:complete
MNLHRLLPLAIALAMASGAPSALAQGPDAGVPSAPDAGSSPDAGAPVADPDAGSAPDAGAPAADPDAGVPPANVSDSEAPDSEPPDSEPPAEPPPATDSGPREGPVEPADEFDDGFSDEAMEAELAALEAEGDDAEEDPTPQDADPDLTFDEVVVSYAPEDVLERAGSGTVLTEDQLETMGYDDPHATLRQVPGVYMRNEDGFGLRPNIGMRGVNPERSKKITLMEDGVLFGPAPYSAPAAYYFPLMARMTQIEVLKGPAALLYGPQTVAGAIDFHTREVPTGSEGGADVAFGRFRSRRLHLHYGASNEWGGFLFEGLDVASAGFKEIDGSNRETGFQRTDFMLRGFLQTNPAARVYHRVSLKLGLGRERSNETYLGLSDADFDADPYRRYGASDQDQMDWWRSQVVLTHRLEVGERFQLTTDLYRHDFDRSWNRVNRFAVRDASGAITDGADLRSVLLYPDSMGSDRYYQLLQGTASSRTLGTDGVSDSLMIIDNHRQYVSQGIQSRFRATFGDDDLRHTLQIGLRLHQDGVERDQVEEGFLLTRGALSPDGLPANPVTRNTAETLAGSAYAAYALEWRRLTVTPGLRAEIIHGRFEDELADTEDSHTRGSLLPGMGVEYTVLPKTDVFVGVHRGFSPVSPDGGSSAEPETSIAYELGARHLDADEGRHLELVGFFNDYDNLLSQCSLSASCPAEDIGRQFNAGAAFVWGVEATAAWRFELGDDYAVPARVVYTYTGSRLRESIFTGDPTLGGQDNFIVAGDELPYLPKHTGQLQVGLEHRLFGIRLVGTYVGESREEAGQGELDPLFTTDDYVLFDAAVEVKPEEHLRVYVRFQNILNQQPVVSRRPFGARTLQPFSFLAGLEATF